MLFGDVRSPYKGEIERFHKSLASLAEIAVFAVSGLTITLGDFDGDVWLDGLLVALLLAFVARPAVVGLLSLPMRLRWGERLFVMWGGLRGAVPIMLGTLALLEGIDDGERVYDMIFIVVAFSVLVQGTSIPFVAPRLGVRMRDTDPGGVVSRVVAVGSSAAGRTLRALPLGERTWVRTVTRSSSKCRLAATRCSRRETGGARARRQRRRAARRPLWLTRAVEEGEAAAGQRPGEAEQHANHRAGHRLRRKRAEPSRGAR